MTKPTRWQRRSALNWGPAEPLAQGPYRVDNLDRKCVVADFGSYHVLICRCRDEKAAELITQALNAQYDAERQPEAAR